MISRILHSRFLVFIIVIFTVVNAVAFVVLGVLLSIEGIQEIFHRGEGHIHPELLLLESLDVFLVALVFLIFAMGIYVLFLRRKQDGEKEVSLPSWLEIEDITELKILLWETVLVSLVVYFIGSVIKKDG